MKRISADEAPPQVRSWRISFLRVLARGLLIWGLAGLLMTFTPMAFGNNDDVLMRALVNGRYTGTLEWDTIHHPLFGLLAHVGYQLVSGIDWYVFLLLGFQLTAMKVIVEELTRKQPVWLRALVLTFGAYALLKLTYPMQYTGVAMILALAGGIRLSSTSYGLKSSQVIRGVLLLLFGLLIRFEAALVVIGLVVLPMVIAHALIQPNRRAVSTAIMKNLLIVVAPIATILVLHSWVLRIDFYSRSAVLEVMSHARYFFENSQDWKIESISSNVSAQDLKVLNLTQGHFIDSFEKAVSLRNLARTDANFFDRIGNYEESFRLLFGREYLVYHATFLIVLLLAALRGRAGAVSLIPTGATLVLLFALAAPYLNNTYNRIPYRLLMPLWVGIICSALHAYRRIGSIKRESTTPTSLPRNGASSSPEFRRNVSHRASILVAVLATFTLVLLSVRYSSFYRGFHRQQEQVMMEKREWVKCLSNRHAFVMAIVPYTLVPGGGHAPIESDAVYEYPSLDTTWILHSSQFKKRASHFGLDLQDSLVELLATSDAAIVTSGETAEVLANLNNQNNPSWRVSARPITGCGVEAWRLDRQT